MGRAGCDESIDRCAGDDAVVIVGEALRLHQALAAPERAAVEIPVVGRTCIEARDDGLGLGRHLVDGAIAEVAQARVVGEPAEVAVPVAGVGRGRRIARGERGAHPVVAQVAGKTRAADGEEASVPGGGCGQPDFEPDRRFHDTANAAMGRQVASQGLATRLRRHGGTGSRPHRAGPDPLDLHACELGQGERGNRDAGLLVGRRRGIEPGRLRPGGGQGQADTDGDQADRDVAFHFCISCSGLRAQGSGAGRRKCSDPVNAGTSQRPVPIRVCRC